MYQAFPIYGGPVYAHDDITWYIKKLHYKLHYKLENEKKSILQIAPQVEKVEKVEKNNVKSLIQFFDTCKVHHNQKEKE